MRFSIFHQNMKSYGGLKVNLNANMKKAFWKINLGYMTHPVLAVGFTEVRNNSSAPKSLAKIAKKLDHRLVNVKTVAVGQTALLCKEYITMVALGSPTAATRFEVQHYGKVTLLNTLAPICVPVGTGVGELGEDDLPPNYLVDFRGLGYLHGHIRTTAADWADKEMVIGFAHNMYNTGLPSTMMGKLPAMVQSIYTKHGIPGTAAAVVGGDFNVPPYNRGWLTSAAEVDEDTGYYIDTTASHVYDYWFNHAGVGSFTADLDHDLDDDDAVVWPQTFGAKRSDHKGVSLELDTKLWL
ncbi:hypothetical protein [Pseudofrankia inefficax]|uniref:Endonuclease/exonuclease/phosphatase n=1 Tax=Pseudofrankia inefficax (strain DSM 45817 / CECT 9037 / DDB 130130 / EuI1c) TaxID=298654 RepID=E3IUI1_PSEI1|nr:hypothetical protein [Pseudofrankia inefficax]ADP83666.1 hypothetical protein FraEuI1c_5682 [Pseudofrankia inefficax]